jgi:hypothetical protein
VADRLSWNSPDEALRNASEDDLNRIYDEYVTFIVDRSGDVGGGCYFASFEEWKAGIKARLEDAQPETPPSGDAV